MQALDSSTLVNLQDAAAPVTGPYRVDPGRGGHDGNVSRQWMARPADQRFPDLNALHDFKKDEWDNAFETRQPTNKVDLLAPEIETVDDMRSGKIHDLFIGLKIANGGDVTRDVVVSPTHYSFGQMCSLAGAPSAYLRDLPSTLVTQNLEWGLRHVREATEIKLWGNEKRGQLMAATGPDYGRIPDYEVIDAIRHIAGSGLGEMRWKTPGTLDWSTNLYHPEQIGDERQRTFYGSDRDMFVFLVDDRNPIEVGKLLDGSPDLMFRGFYIQNSEVGARSLKLSWFYLRGVCMNRNLWGVEGVSEVVIRHSRLAPDRWLQQAVPQLNSFIENSSARLIEGVGKAKAAKVANDDEEAMAFLKRSNALTGARIKRIMELNGDGSPRQEGQPGPRTVWDFAQAATAMARDLPNNDDRLDVEMSAKRWLDKVA